jgi:hypothetical protein
MFSLKRVQEALPPEQLHDVATSDGRFVAAIPLDLHRPNAFGLGAESMLVGERVRE